MGKKRDPNIITRTISTWDTLNPRQTQIFRFMSHESKNIYNASIFHTRIYLNYSDNIFKKIYELVMKKKILNITDLDANVSTIYDDYFKRYLLIKPMKQYNNNIIYKQIKNELAKFDLVNDNYFSFEKSIIKKINKLNLLKFPPNMDTEIKHELFYGIVSSILKSIYNKNFKKTLESIENEKECEILDKKFIEQVKKNEHLFAKDGPKNTYKALLKKHELFRPVPVAEPNKSGSKVSKKTVTKKSVTKKSKKKGENELKSDQYYTAKIVCKYYTNPKIPDDVMWNIIPKAYNAYSSFFSSIKKGIKAKIPNFLDKNGSYVLPFYKSRKDFIIKREHYYRLTVGQKISDNFPKIIDDDRFIRVRSGQRYKHYVNKDHLIPIPNGEKILKATNYLYGNHFIPKNSPRIVPGYHIFIKKPKPLINKKIILIEIVPVYEGHRFKINFIYNVKKTRNKPIKGKCISIDLGMKNLATIYDPKGEQYIINGTNIISINKYFNDKVSQVQSTLSTNKKTKKDAKTLYLNEANPQIEHIDGKNKLYDHKRQTKNSDYNKRKNEQLDYVSSNGKIKLSGNCQLTSNRMRKLLVMRENKINDYFNKIVKWISKTYKDCETIIIGYNTGWKTNVNMGKKMNGQFYDIPYRKLITKLQNKLEKNNQCLEETEESYTSKCDALALEEIGYHNKYLGKRVKRGLFSSSTGVLLNADMNGAINIMRKWKQKQGIEMKKITGKNLCNPIRVKGLH